MSEIVFRTARFPERQRIIDFVNANFDWRLPLINRTEFFEYYYADVDLQFVLAEQDGELLSVAGYIRANHSAQPDVWVSVWVAAKGHNGVGLELMNALPGLLNARVVACNNIRANTCSFYRFLGWTAERMGHFYRLADKDEYKLAKVACKEILPAMGDLHLDPVSSIPRLRGLGLPDTDGRTPAKDTWYIGRRYFAFPHLHYQVWSASEQGKLLAYLATRVVESGENGEIPVLRIVDYIGAPSLLPRLGAAIDRLLTETGAEYADFYCAGIPAETMAAAGFSERTENDENIIPNYLTPPLYENTDYYYFTNRPEHFVMFKADGDQDRPNLSADE